MKQSKLIKMKADKQGCHIWTVSYNGKSPGKFFILREEGDKVEKEGKLIVRDLYSFADIKVQEEPGRQKKVRLQIFWLESVGEEYKGKMETICIPYEKFQEAFQGGNTLIKSLDLKESKLPKIIFNSRKNLK